MAPKFTLPAFVLVALFLLPGFADPGHPADAAAPKLKYPKKVDAIIQNKCYGCHSPQGRSDEAKQELQWDDLTRLPADEAGEKLNNIIKVLDEGSMPPARFIEGNPDKKLTEAETATLKKWAEKAAKKSMK